MHTALLRGKIVTIIEEINSLNPENIIGRSVQHKQISVVSLPAIVS